MTTKLHNEYGTLRITNAAEDVIYDALYDMDCKRHTRRQCAFARYYWRKVGYWQPDTIETVWNSPGGDERHGYYEAVTVNLSTDGKPAIPQTVYVYIPIPR